MDQLKTFTVVDTETQRTKEIKSSATTVGELKRDLRQNGFNVDGKTIQEALTRVRFEDDEALLPHDVSYRGTITNDLVFRLTKTNKNVKSGMDRKEAYDQVKKLGLADDIKARYGKNFTQVSTADLVNFIENSSKKACKKAAQPANKKDQKEPKDNCMKNPKQDCQCMKALGRLCDVLIENDYISEDDRLFILGDNTEVSEGTSKYDKDELNELLRGL